MAESDREIGALGAQVEMLGEQVKALTKQMAEQNRTLQSIQLELASARGAGRVVIGIAVLFGGIASFIVQKFLGRFF